MHDSSVGREAIEVARQFSMERAAVAEVVESGRPRLWLWRPAMAIVLTARERELAKSPAAQSFAAQGWHICVRDSGGGPVALGPACLNVSWLTPVLRAISIEQSFLEFCEPLLAAMAGLGVTAYCAALPGSYCDGRFNLLVNGRKLAGTSQRIYRTTRGDARLSHAVLHVLPGAAQQLECLNRFLSITQSGARLSAEHLTCVTDVKGDASYDDVYGAVARELQGRVAGDYFGCFTAAPAVVPPSRTNSEPVM